MIKDLLLQKQNTKKIGSRRIGCDLISLALCVSILISAVAFALPVIALTHPEGADDAVVSQSVEQQTDGCCNDSGFTTGNGEPNADTADRIDLSSPFTHVNSTAEMQSVHGGFIADVCAFLTNSTAGFTSAGDAAIADSSKVNQPAATGSASEASASAFSGSKSGAPAPAGGGNNTGASEAEDSAVPVKTDSDLASTGDGEYVARLTDRSNDIGVYSEGYTDSPYNYSKEYNASANLWVADQYNTVGGTVYVGRGALTGNNIKVWQAEQYWDGKVPFRITSAAGAEGTLDFQTYNDFALENSVAPNGAFKLDNLALEYCKVNLSTIQNLFARGNKLVIGEGITTESGADWRIYGGTEHDQAFEETGRPQVVTNVVVASGDWGHIFGGGEGPTGRGTQVTIRDDANVENVYGGGERRGSIGLQDYAERNQGVLGEGTNVYVEGGTVGNLWGGNWINSYTSGAVSGAVQGKHPLPIYGNIDINISGGHVDRLIAGSDCTDDQTNEYSNMGESQIHGDAIVNITAANSVGSAAGDPNRNTPRAATNVRQVQGITQLNVSASNAFSYFDLFDFVNITGDGETANGVVVSTDSKAGETFVDDPLTFWSSSNSGNPKGFIGSIRVADGAKLVLNHGGTINAAYDHYVGGTWQYNAYEGNRTLKGSTNGATHYLSKSWIGETSEARRSLSTLAINGHGAGITVASGSSFNDSTNTCGLRIHGNVQGQIANNMTDYSMDVPGYSTLEVTDTPIYSTGANYYYYVVADSSANGGKAFKEPEGADYIVCYRYLDNGTKIGWYLREKPEISDISNKLVRVGDTSSANEVVMHVTMNSFGYEWNSTASENTADFQITKITTNGTATSSVSDNITLATLAGIKTDTSGRFRNVVTTTDSDNIEYLVSFDYVIDNTTPLDPTYYLVEADYHVERSADNYEDVRTASDVKDAARIVYDFAGNDSNHWGTDSYADSVMTTFPYSSLPTGADTAMLRIYMPVDGDGNQVTGTLSASENDNHFRFTTDTTIDAQLDASTTVTSNYATANASTANSHFGVTIDGSDLSDGISGKALTTTANNKFVCTVSSYKNLSLYDISQNTASGLQLNLTVSGLTKDGEPVGTGNPTATNNGELQIQTAGTYKITYHFTTRTQGDKIFVVKGNLGDASIDANGHLTSEFVLSKAPYESNHGENLNWNAANIIHSYINGVLSADLTATQSSKMVSLNYRLTASGPYSSSVMVPIGANRINNSSVAAITTSESTFKYWEIRKSGASTAPVYARCYDAEFSYCIMDDYWISPVFESLQGDKTVRLNPDALKAGNEDWLAWTYHYNASNGEGALVFPSEDLTFTGLKDMVVFVRVPKGTTTLGNNWSNVWNQSADLDLNNYDGKTYVMTHWYNDGYSQKMGGEWSDTLTLTQTDYSRNRWTDADGNLSANGRSDYLYSDFEISYKDGAPREVFGSDSYRTGVVFELCGSLGENDTFDPDSYTYKSNAANLKAAILSRSSSYAADYDNGNPINRRIQCNDISTDNLTNMNRIELGKSYFNTPTNSKAIMKVTAYLVDGNNNVTLSNSVYICLYDTSLMDLAINVG